MQHGEERHQGDLRGAFQYIKEQGGRWPALGGGAPSVESSVQESHEPVGVHPEEGHKNDPRDGTPLLRGQTERAGAAQPGEEKALR